MAEEYSNPLLSLIREQGMLDDLQYEEVVAEVQRSNAPVTQILQDFGIMKLDDILHVVANALGTEVVSLRDREISPELLQCIPAKVAQMYKCLPVGLNGSVLQVAVADPLNPQLADEIHFSSKRDIQIVIADPTDVEKAVERYYGTEDSGNFADILKELGADADIAREVDQASTGDAKAVEALANEVPIVKFVNLVLQQAIQDRASDIHFEPFETEFHIRYRVDGALYEMSPPPKHLSLPVISRIKVMANLNISEKRLPQDGRITINLAGRQVDLRVATLPTAFGESVVLRVLDRSSGQPRAGIARLSQICPRLRIGSHPAPQRHFRGAPGPTGCGKTTTLYSCLRRVNTIDSKLLTAEDPVEFDIDGIMQVAVNEGVGMTFAKALKSFLRQDPDIIMVGEMRDLETAQISIQASLTGHLVLSTLHTNDSPGAVTRLVDMGIEPFLISSTLMAVLGQRLWFVPFAKTAARRSSRATENQLSLLNLSPHDLGDKVFHYGRGCSTCNGTSYKGRQGGIYLSFWSSPNPSGGSSMNVRPRVVLRQKSGGIGDDHLARRRLAEYFRR